MAGPIATRITCCFAAYMRDISVQKHRELTKTKELAMTLLSASPMASPCASEDVTDAETTSFSASVHIRFFEDVFHFYGQNVHEWALCQVADNCNTNKRIADFYEYTSR